MSSRILGRLVLCVVAGALVLVLTAVAKADAFGLSIATLDDLDGDGTPELLIGDPYDTESEEEVPGRVWVVSGATGKALRTHQGRDARDYYGDCVAQVGDVDGDGLRDYAAGAPFLADDVPGYVRVFSARTGRLALETETPQSKRGVAIIADAGDVDRDGVPDLALGLPRQVAREGTGEVEIVSGRTGRLIRALSTGRTFGADVVRLDDLDGDGLPELAVGTRPGLWQSGAVEVFAGADGNSVKTLPIPRLLGAGDFDGDGRLDLLAGDPRGLGTLTAWSLDGEALQVWSAPRAVSVSVLGDVDGDGAPDLVVGAQVELTRPATVRVLSGRTSETLREHVLGYAPRVLCSGMTVHGGPDLDREGVPDYLAGTGTTSASAECCFVRAWSGRTGELLYELTRERLAADLR